MIPHGLEFIFAQKIRSYLALCTVPPSSKTEDDSVFISTIPRFIYSQKCTHLLLVGDFNAPQAEWVPGSNEYTSFSYSLIQLISG